MGHSLLSVDDRANGWGSNDNPSPDRASLQTLIKEFESNKSEPRKAEYLLRPLC